MITLFRILIIISLLSIILGIVVAIIFDQNHLEIENFLSHMNNEVEFFKIPDAAAMIICFLILIAYFTINIALLSFKSWARDANLVLNLLGFLISPFLGFIVLSPQESLFYDLATFIGGLILALSYFSPLRDQFKGSFISRAFNRSLVEKND